MIAGEQRTKHESSVCSIGGAAVFEDGGLADVVEALPKALVAQGHEVAVVLPRYRGTKATAVVMPSLTIPMGGTRLRFPRLPMARS